jgi:hypothetical protein
MLLHKGRHFYVVELSNGTKTYTVGLDVDLHGSCSTSTSTRDKTFLMIGAICSTPIWRLGKK